MLPEFRAAGAFALAGEITAVAPLGNGLINDTFLVSTDDPAQAHTVLQRINRYVFPQPERIMQNLRRLTSLGCTPIQNGMRLPDIVCTHDGADFFVDEQNEFWRALTYLDGTVSHDTVGGTAQAREVGTMLGRFHVFAGKLDPATLHVTRPGFHQTPGYYRRFETVLAQAKADTATAESVTFAQARRGIVSRLEEAKRQSLLPLRVIHGDPKIDNFMFDPHSGKAVGLIDLDAVQPGLVHYDIGDCLRSCANPVGETPANLDDVRVELDIVHAVLASYLAETSGFLTRADLEYLFDAIQLIPFELGLRFLTDHLEGNVYFKTQWPGHNLHRAKAQFRLAADIERNENRIRGLIADLSC